MKDFTTSTLAKMAEKGYTPVQMANAATRKLAHVEAHGTHEDVAKWTDVLLEAKKMRSQFFAKAEPGQFPCNKECMGAHEDECVCWCEGVNHKFNATKVAA